MHYSWAADTNEGKIMRYFKTILVAAASFAVLACGSESAAPPPNSPAKINPPKTPTVTPVKASAADVELSPEELQLKPHHRRKWTAPRRAEPLRHSGR